MTSNGCNKKMKPLWTPKDLCIPEEKEKLIKQKGGDSGLCASGFEDLKVLSVGKELQLLEVMEINWFGIFLI